MPLALLTTEIALSGGVSGTATYGRAQESYALGPTTWTERAPDLIADAIQAAGQDANQVSEEAMGAARRVLNLLADLPSPAVAVDDNEITLEWYKDKHHVAVLAVDGQSVSWAVMAGPNKPEKGKIAFDNALPEEVYAAINAVGAA